MPFYAFNSCNHMIFLKKVKDKHKTPLSSDNRTQGWHSAFSDPKISDSNKTLIINDRFSWIDSEGYSKIKLDTYCFNQGSKAPSEKMYALVNIKSVGYRNDMSQGEVCEFT